MLRYFFISSPSTSFFGIGTDFKARALEQPFFEISELKK